MKAVLEKICAAMVVVTERQLADFLPNGRYHNVEDPDLWEKLEHSHITNLVAEECFADLDFSLFKRRNSSLHHHSTVNMLKRNKSVTSWFMKKSANEQTELLKMSARKSLSLREKHQQMLKDTVVKRTEYMLEVQRKQQAAQLKKEQKVLDLMENLRPHHGPCSTAEDVDRLLQVYSTIHNLKMAVRAELLFHKMVLDKKSPLLKVTGTPLTLFNRLKQLFGTEPLQRLPPLLREVQPRKRVRTEATTESASEANSDTDNEDGQEHEEGSEENILELDFEQDFKFTRRGELIGVYYMEDFFIGEVTTVVSEDDAEVNFMEKATGKSSVFRWPHRLDCCNISSSVVFVRNLALSPCSSSGRAFIVERPTNLPGRYQAFKQFLQQNLDL